MTHEKAFIVVVIGAIIITLIKGFIDSIRYSRILKNENEEMKETERRYSEAVRKEKLARKSADEKKEALRKGTVDEMFKATLDAIKKEE